MIHFKLLLISASSIFPFINLMYFEISLNVLEYDTVYLLKLMNEKGLTDVFFVMDYADGDSPFYDEGGGCHCQVNEKYHLVILKKEEESTLHRKFDKLLETNLGKVYVSSRYEMMFDQKNVVDYSVDKYGFYLKSEAGILSMRLNIDFIA